MLALHKDVTVCRLFCSLHLFSLAHAAPDGAPWQPLSFEHHAAAWTTAALLAQQPGKQLSCARQICGVAWPPGPHTLGDRLLPFNGCEFSVQVGKECC